MNKNWVYHEIPEDKVKKLSEVAGISRLLSTILLNRGIDSAEAATRFLHPSIGDFYDPFLLKDMDRAADRIINAVEIKEKVTIYGDYDADGVTSTSMLYRFLKELGHTVSYYIPDRLDEGYGLSVSAMEKIKAEGTTLIITVDTGISAIDEIEYANSLGMQVVVIDHHECREQLPDALAVVNPCRKDSGYPFRELAGAGVVFKLIQAISERLSLGDIYLKYIDLAALATVADVVPLLDENRVIVKFGLEAMQETRNPGLAALMDVAGLSGKPLGTYSVGFGIGPRINAAGRIGDAERAVRLFITENTDIAGQLARELDVENRNRQEMEAEIFRNAVEIVEKDIDLETEKVIVVSGSGWHHGVIGIVASKITEKYYRPSILISMEDGVGKGSGRSIEGFNLFDALCNCSGLLDKFGGHELAAGLTLKEENLPLFRRMINEYAQKVLKDEDLVPGIHIDAYADAEALSIDIAEQLELLAPFGAGNPGPVLACRCLEIREAKTVGDGKHLKLKLCGDTTGRNTVDAIGFNLGAELSCYKKYDSMSAAFSLEINCWNNIRKVQLNIKDIKPAGAADKDFIVLDKNIVFSSSNDYNIDYSLPAGLSLHDIIPERDDIGAVYKYLRSTCGGSLETDDMFAVACIISDKYNISMNYFKLSKSIQILMELGLLKADRQGRMGIKVSLQEAGNGKTSLDRSYTFRGLQELKNRVG